jgi:hypothetical protein
MFGCCCECGRKTVSLFVPWKGFSPWAGCLWEYGSSYARIEPDADTRYLTATRTQVVTDFFAFAGYPPWCDEGMGQLLRASYTATATITLHKFGGLLTTMPVPVVEITGLTFACFESDYCQTVPDNATIIAYLDTIYSIAFMDYISLHVLDGLPGEGFTTDDGSVTATTRYASRAHSNGWTKETTTDVLSVPVTKSEAFDELIALAQDYDLTGQQKMEMLLDYGSAWPVCHPYCLTPGAPTLQDMWFAPDGSTVTEGDEQTDAILVFLEGLDETDAEVWRVTPETEEYLYQTDGIYKYRHLCGIPDYIAPCFSYPINVWNNVDGTSIYTSESFGILGRADILHRELNTSSMVSACLNSSPYEEEIIIPLEGGGSLEWWKTITTSLIAIRRTRRPISSPDTRCLIQRDFSNETIFLETVGECGSGTGCDPPICWDTRNFGLLHEVSRTCLAMPASPCHTFEPVKDAGEWLSSTTGVFESIWTPRYTIYESSTVEFFDTYSFACDPC